MKTLVITGTGKGIGKATALLAAQQGHRVIALSRNIDSLKGLENIFPYSVDLSSPKAIALFADEFQAKGWKIDALINNAGQLINSPFSETNFDDFTALYKVNVFGVAELTRQLLPIISSKGHVVNVSSMGGIRGSAKFPGLAAYSSSKGAVITLTELLAEEYKETGPSFNALALGAVQTEMLAQAFPGFKAPVTADEFSAYLLNFALTGQQFYNGKVLEVSSSTP